MKATDNETTKRNYRYYTMPQTNTHPTALKYVLMHILLLGIILLFIGVSSASVGYSTINLINYNDNRFININSTIPLSNYTFELHHGINWIGMPCNTTITCAADLLNDIPNITIGSNVKNYNTSSGACESWARSPWGDFGTNFLVKPNRGYEIYMSMDASWTIECFQPVNPILQYQCFDLNKYIGTNIVRVKNI